jgi:signal transduction histidine kinase/ActR/RegA family two-component response regulator
VRAGAFDYIIKPFPKEILLRAVANAARVKSLSDERRVLAETNRQYQEQLEHLVEERTRELRKAMDELKTAQLQMLQQERLKALGQMASGIAHDFNNVLMPIIGLPALMLDNPALLENKAEVTRTLKDILSAANDAREIVRRLREFYRPEERPETRPIAVNDLFARVLALTEPAWKAQAQASGKNIRVETDCGDKSMVVNGNEAALREMMTNLVLNSIDAIAQRGTIRLVAAKEGNWVVLRVSDSGGGMPEEVRMRCFEPFFSTKGKHGTGLGLSMCHGIVQRHGGQITVDSEPGHGTVFTIRLPRNAPAGETKTDAAAPANQSTAALHLKVLAIDDEALSRALVSKYLTAKGHAVDTAASGVEGLAKLRAGKYDVVITDRAMAGIGGDEVAAMIKKISPTMPVLMLTGFGDLMKFKSERPGGVDHVLGKPVTPDELAQAVELLAREKGK